MVALIRRHGLDVWVYRGADWYVTDPKAPHVAREQWTVQFAPKVVSELDDLLDKAVKVVGVSDDLAAVARCEAEAQTSGRRLCRALTALLPGRDSPGRQQGHGREVPLAIAVHPARPDRHHRRHAERRADVQGQSRQHRDGQRQRGGEAPGQARRPIEHRRGLRTRGGGDLSCPKRWIPAWLNSRPAEKASRPMDSPAHLYMLPFDRRESFERRLLGFQGGSHVRCIVLGSNAPEAQVKR